MTDLEITRLCAQAFHGDKWGEHKGRIGYPVYTDADVEEAGPRIVTFEPLRDDAQAMAMLKTFRIAIGRDENKVRAKLTASIKSRWCQRTELNRAICECVAKMQSAKTA